MSRSQDSWEDASPFAWIFGGALAVVGLGAALSATRRRKQARREQVWAAPVRGPRPQDPAAVDDDVLGVHPS